MQSDDQIRLRSGNAAILRDMRRIQPLLCHLDGLAVLTRRLRRTPHGRQLGAQTGRLLVQRTERRVHVIEPATERLLGRAESTCRAQKKDEFQDIEADGHRGNDEHLIPTKCERAQNPPSGEPNNRPRHSYAVRATTATTLANSHRVVSRIRPAVVAWAHGECGIG